MYLYSPSTGGFYTAEIHGNDVPADAVKVTARKHRELLDAQGRGAVITMGKSGPIARMPVMERAALIAHVIARVKREAKRRCLAIASLEQQSNDNAGFALGFDDALEGHKALTRRQQINSVRLASNEIESHLTDLSAAALTAFDVRNCGAWPSFEVSPE